MRFHSRECFSALPHASQSGASPLLLPPPVAAASPAPAAPRRGAAPAPAPPLAERAPACDTSMDAKGLMPRRAVLERSEFLLPLSAAAAAEFGALMTAAQAAA
jgi:hypothetical protein